MHDRLPSGSASTQNAGARGSSTSVPPASMAAWIRASATSWGTLTSRCQRCRSGASESVFWNQTAGVRSGAVDQVVVLLRVVSQ